MGGPAVLTISRQPSRVKDKNIKAKLVTNLSNWQCRSIQLAMQKHMFSDHAQIKMCAR